MSAPTNDGQIRSMIIPPRKSRLATFITPENDDGRDSALDGRGTSEDSIDQSAEDAFPDVIAQVPLEEDSSSASSASSTGTIIPSSNRKLFARAQSNSTANERSWSPIPWTVYYERELFIDTRAGDVTTVHHVYLTSPVGSGPLFVMHHGAGSSGLSFALVAAEVRKRLPSAGVLSLDARGHGATLTQPQSAGDDLRLEILSADLVRVVEATKMQMAWPVLPPLVLVGHSLGGAVVTSVAHSGALGNSVLGHAVLDVVEGSAMDALQSMHTYLSHRPLGFGSIEAGIEWHLRSRTLRNATSARISVPALLHPGEAGGKSFTWRTDLAATQAFWEGWFVGLSKKFLEARGGKLLLLAGTDRLDKELTIGQMQGKYALQVFPEAGHFIHEDLPEKTALVLVDFYHRNDRSALVLPPKVADLLKAGKRV